MNKQTILDILGLDEETLRNAISEARKTRAAAAVNSAVPVPNILLDAASHERVARRKRDQAEHQAKIAAMKMLIQQTDRFIPPVPILLAPVGIK